VTMILTATALFLSLTALGFSLGAWLAMRRSSTGRLSRQLAELSQTQEDLNLQLRSVKVRLSALSRPRKNGRFVESDEPEPDPDAPPDPQRNPAAWKREMNLKLALGRLKP